MRHWLGTAVVAAGCGLTSACGASASTTGPSPLPFTTTPATGGTTVASSTTTTATASATTTVDPNSDTAIIAAVHAYAAGFEASARTASVGPYNAVTTSACNCRSQIDALVMRLQASHETTNVMFEVADIQITGRSGDRAEATFELVSGPYEVFGPHAKVVATAAAAEAKDDVNFELSGEVWLAYLTV